MADTKISALPASSTPLAGTEVLPIVQSSTTKQVSVANLTAGRAISATQLTLTTGNLVVASGQGVDFSATPGTGTSELLADYEEGNWTPIISSQAGSLTSYSSAGVYTKVGRVVTLQGFFLITNAGTALSYANLAGLPFTAMNVTAQAGNGLTVETDNTGNTYVATVTTNSTTGVINAFAGGGITWVNGYRYVFTLTYQAA